MLWSTCCLHCHVHALCMCILFRSCVSIRMIRHSRLRTSTLCHLQEQATPSLRDPIPDRGNDQRPSKSRFARPTSLASTRMLAVWKVDEYSMRTLPALSRSEKKVTRPDLSKRCQCYSNSMRFEKIHQDGKHSPLDRYPQLPLDPAANTSSYPRTCLSPVLASSLP